MGRYCSYEERSSVIASSEASTRISVGNFSPGAPTIKHAERSLRWDPPAPDWPPACLPESRAERSRLARLKSDLFGVGGFSKPLTNAEKTSSFARKFPTAVQLFPLRYPLTGLMLPPE